MMTVTEHTDDYLHPYADVMIASLQAEERLKAKLQAIKQEATAVYSMCQEATISAAKNGNQSLGQHVIASGVAHKFMRLAK